MGFLPVETMGKTCTHSWIHQGLKQYVNEDMLHREAHDDFFADTEELEAAENSEILEKNESMNMFHSIHQLKFTYLPACIINN